MPSLNNGNKSAHLSRILQQEILSGKYPENQPLKSIRQLADEYSVGRQVVYSAFQRLEKMKLLESRGRNGFIVRSRRNIRERGIMFAAYVRNKTNIYALNMMNLTSPAHLPPNYNAWSRIIMDNQEMMDDFRGEFRKLSEVPGIDAMLLLAPTLTPEQYEIVRRLPFPVIFLGDFMHRGMEQLNIAQVVENSSDHIPMGLRYLLRDGSKKVALLTFRYPGALFHQHYLSEFSNCAEESGIEIHTVFFPENFKKLSPAAQKKTTIELLNSIPADFRHFYLSGIDFDDLTEHCPELRDGKYSFLSSANNSNRIPCILPDYTKFFHRLYELVEEALSGHDIAGYHKIHAEYKIVEYNPEL